jgi:hypothetical protein
VAPNTLAVYNTAITTGPMSAITSDGYGSFRNRDAPTTGVGINGKDKNNITVGLGIVGYPDAQSLIVSNADLSIRTTYGSTYYEYMHPAFGYTVYADLAVGQYAFKVVTTAQTSYYLFQGGTGNAICNNGNWVSNSDASNKENVVSLATDAKIAGKAVDLIAQLNPCSYNRIGVDAVEVGFIAQELAEVLPNVMVPYTYEEGPTEEGVEPVIKESFGLNYNGIVAYQTLAIQELNELVKALEARLATLEALQ